MEHCLREAGLIEVAASGLDWNTEPCVVQSQQRRGAGQQQVLDRRRLKGAVVGPAEHDARMRDLPCRGEPRTHRTLVDHQSIVVEPYACADRQGAETHEILHKRTLLAI